MLVWLLRNQSSTLNRLIECVLSTLNILMSTFTTFGSLGFRAVKSWTPQRLD